MISKSLSGLYDCNNTLRHLLSTLLWIRPLIVRRVGEGNGTPLQYSCLENPMDGGGYQPAVHGVTKSWTRLSDFTFTFHFHALEKEMATRSSVFAWRQRSLVGCRLWGRTELDTTEATAAAAVGRVFLLCFIFLFIYVFIFGRAGMLLPCGLSSSCKRGYSLVAAHGLLLLQSTVSRALWLSCFGFRL